jgi:phosphoserine phosphatase RsbU/P
LKIEGDGRVTDERCGGVDSEAVLDSLNDGIYVVNRDREVVHWGKSSQRITGWTPDDVLGKRCSDGILCHVDKDDHQLCGEEHCPLHRAMVTGQSSTTPIIVFAQTKDGRRVPLRVSVSPIRDSRGKVTGGVETFHDLSDEISDLQRVKRIQSVSLGGELTEDPRIEFRTRYVPHDVIGGDYYAMRRIDEDRYGFLLADVTGHGASAALYTMCLSSLWLSNQAISSSPAKFARQMSKDLCELVGEEIAFAAAVCGVVDLKQGTLRLAGAGNPPPVLIRSSGQWENLDSSGLPLGLMADAQYEETCVEIKGGDCLLLFTDGAVEVHDADGRQLGTDGLTKILKALGYPSAGASFEAIEEEMLKFSNRIRFDDDLTFLEIRVR